MIKIKNINKAKDLCHLPNHLYFLNMVNYSGDILPEQFQFDDQLTFITLSSDTKVIGEKAFANDIAFIEIGQLEGNDGNQIELYNLKSYIDIERKS